MDGLHIDLLLTTLFLYHLPQLVEAGKVYIVQSPVYKVKTARKEIIYFYSEKEAQKWFKTHSGFSAIHVKGLGELEPDELYETTMNPDNRHLTRLTTENFKRTLDLYNRLMGNQPSLRRDFILSHGLRSEDELFEDDEGDVDVL